MVAADRIPSSRSSARGFLQAPPDPGRRPQGVHGSGFRRRQHGRDRPRRRRLQGHALRLFRRQEPAVRGDRRGGSARQGRSRSISTRPAMSPPSCGSSARPISSLICRPGGGSAIRTVMAIAERMPDVGRRYYERVLEGTINRLADYLEARVEAERSCDRGLPARRFAIPVDVPGVAVPAVHLPGRTAPSPERIATSSTARPDVFRGVPGEGSLSASAGRHFLDQHEISLHASLRAQARSSYPSPSCGEGGAKRRVGK